MSDIKNLLVEEVQAELEGLQDIEIGTDEYKTTVDGLTKLVDRVIEMDKMDISYNDKIDENEFKSKQADEEKKDRWIKNGLTAAGIVIPTFVTIWGTLKSFKFEEEGTITTTLGRGFINKLLPKK